VEAGQWVDLEKRQPARTVAAQVDTGRIVAVEHGDDVECQAHGFIG